MGFSLKGKRQRAKDKALKVRQIAALGASPMAKNK